MNEPSLRKPLGVLLMLAYIALWVIGALMLSPYVLTMAWPVQAIFFAIVGVAWIFPVKSLLIWMETGNIR